MCKTVTGYMSGGLIDPYTPDYAGQASAQEQHRQTLIKQGKNRINKAFAGFDQPFYDQRAAAYTQFAMPQLSDQYNQFRGQIGFNLANRGLFGSSTGNQQFSNLEKEMSRQKQGIVDAGRAQAQDLQNKVEAERNTLIGQVYQGADPAGAARAATAAASNFQQPSVAAPIGNMFSNLAATYYQNALINSYRPSSYVSMPEMGGYGFNSGALPKV